ncbi:MAG: hypothetical protein U0Y82_06180 [Thermoleophilia bacterium]
MRRLATAAAVGTTLLAPLAPAQAATMMGRVLRVQDGPSGLMLQAPDGTLTRLRASGAPVAAALRDAVGDPALITTRAAGGSAATVTAVVSGQAQALTVAPASLNVALLVLRDQNGGQVTDPVTARDQIFGGTTGVSAFYLAQSFGHTSVSADAYGPYDATITGCDPASVANQALDAAQTAGVDLSPYTNVMILMPDTPACSWLGLGVVSGSVTWLNGTTMRVAAAHELGHNLGLAHASALQSCHDGAAQPVAYPGSQAACTAVEYGDPWDTMGRPDSYATAMAGEFSVWSKVRLGWLPAGAITTVGTAADVVLHPLEDGTGSAYGVRFPVGAGQMVTVDARLPTGFDTLLATLPSASTGVRVRLEGADSGGIDQQKLLDAHPSTSVLTDANLDPGQTLAVGTAGAQLTLTGVDGAGAHLHVAPPTDVTPPGVPAGVVASPGASPRWQLVWAASTDDVGVQGYRVYRDGVLVGTTATTGLTVTEADMGAHAYTVSAVDYAGNESARSARATVQLVDRIPPALSGTSSLQRVGAKACWTMPAATDASATLTYELHRGATVVATLTQAPGGGPVTLCDPAPPAGPASYQVQVTDAAHNVTLSAALAWSGQTGVGPARPAAPVVVSVRVLRGGARRIRWRAPAGTTPTRYIVEVRRCRATRIVHTRATSLVVPRGTRWVGISAERAGGKLSLTRAIALIRGARATC